MNLVERSWDGVLILPILSHLETISFKHSYIYSDSFKPSYLFGQNQLTFYLTFLKADIANGFLSFSSFEKTYFIDYEFWRLISQSLFTSQWLI